MRSRELTLDDRQEDDDDEEEKGDVEKDAVKLVGVAGRVLDLIPYTPSRSHPDVHVEEVTLQTEREAGSAMTSANQDPRYWRPTVIMSSHFISGSSSSSLLL